MIAEAPLLTVRNLKKYFPVHSDFWGKSSAYVKAVDGVSFSLQRGETLGLVGESGCGKSTVGRMLLNLYQPTAGEILFDQTPLAELVAKQAIPRHMQMIFQDPYASLNPRMTAGDIIGEPLTIHRLATGREQTERIKDLLALVGLNPSHKNRFPHEFSGGQRQRIGIARALAAEPELIVCDEPISALDVSIQAQVVNLLEDLQAKLGLTYLFIAHDLAMVKHISQRIAVMYLGKIVEIAPSSELYHAPQHPYTQALLSAIPLPDPSVEVARKRIPLTGEVPSPLNPPSGCSFRTRCPQAMPVCAGQTPGMTETGFNHYAACHLLKQS